MASRPLTVAWISFFPVEWLPDAPDEVKRLPKQHPATWQRVLLAEFEKQPDLRLHIFSLRKQYRRSESFERNGVTFHLIKTPGGLRAPSLFWIDTILVRRVLRQIRPDLIHAWGTENGAALVASRMRVPYLITMQGILSWMRQFVELPVYFKLAELLERRSLARATIATTEASFAVRFLTERYANLSVRQIEHAPAHHFHRVIRRPRIAPLRFLFTGALTQAKGADLLLDSLEKIRSELDFELTIVCSHLGDAAAQYRQRVSPELWGRIRFRENLTSEEVAGELAEATVFLYPTRADTSPNSVKEAVVAGVPVVASRVGGIVDYVYPGRNGVLFDSGNSAAFVAAIREACGHELFRAGRVASATLAEVRESLSPQRMATRFLEAYEAVVSGRIRPQ